MLKIEEILQQCEDWDAQQTFVPERTSEDYVGAVRHLLFTDGAPLNHDELVALVGRSIQALKAHDAEAENAKYLEVLRMDEKKQNEACCEMLGWDAEIDCLHLSEAVTERTRLYRFGLDGAPGKTLPLFTRDDNTVRLLRAKVIEAGVWGDYVSWLWLILGNCDPEDGQDEFDADDLRLLMQATPAQQVEAALRALGKWEES